MSAARAHFGLLGLALLVRRSLRQHLVSTTITAAAIGLGCGLVMAVFVIQQQAERAFTGDSVGFDAVLGARGSKLQLVLSSVFHVEQSPGNVGWDTYQQVARHPGVELAIPYALGDNYAGFRIIGTVHEQFTAYRDGNGAPLQFAEGAVFDPRKGEAVLGSFVAARTGLKIGDSFHAFHGLNYDQGQQHADEFRVVGILAATNTPIDRVIWVPLQCVFHMEGHVLRGAGTVFDPHAAAGAETPDTDDHAEDHADAHAGHRHADDDEHGHDHDPREDAAGETAFGIPVEHLEFSAVMVKLRGPQAGFEFDEIINRRGKTATFAWPISTITTEFFQKLGWMTSVLRQIAYLVVLIAAATILASIYNTINERRRQFAILRALGARRMTVFSAVIAECKTIAALGAIVGWGVYLLIVTVAGGVLRREVGIVLDPLAYHPVLWLAPLGVIALGGLVGIIPAWKAYSTDVATNLIPRT